MISENNETQKVIKIMMQYVFKAKHSPLRKYLLFALEKLSPYFSVSFLLLLLN